MQPGVGYRFISSSSGVTLDIGDPWPSPDVSDAPCPLEVYNIREVSGAIKFNVYPGMVNNQVVRSDDMVLLTNDPPPIISAFLGGVTSSLQTNYVYIRCGNSGTLYPNTSGDGRPSVRVYDTEPVDDDTYSYVLIAVLTAQIIDSDYVLKIQRMIGCNSLWSVRMKCGTDTAVYYWSAV
jgi:hypothetical protein